MPLYEEVGNLAKAKENLIAFPIGMRGTVSQRGTLDIACEYPKLFSTFSSYCRTLNYDRERLLGKTFTTKINDKTLIFLICEEGYVSTNSFVNYAYFKKALDELVHLVKPRKERVALPYGIFSKGRKENDWRIIHSIIKFVFKDIDCSLYKGVS